MAFNGKMKRQEALSKEDVQLLIEAMKSLDETNDQVKFLMQKLERMRKAFRS